MNNRSHLAIDLDALEAQLDPTEAARQGRRPQFDDARLAELARIVGQDDRFRTLLPQAAAAPAWPGEAPTARRAFGNDDTPAFGHGEGGDAYAHDGRPYASAPDEPTYQDWEGGSATAARLPHGSDRDAMAEPDDSQALDPTDEFDDEPVPPSHASRRRLYLVGAAIAVIAVGAVGAVAMRGGDGVAATGEAPVIKADSSPVKVQPPQDGTSSDTTPNKAIYERVGQPASANTKVVDGREEPVDVQQTVRQQAAVTVPSERSDVSTFGAPGVAALPSNPTTSRDPTAGLGEPRRVKTIAVRPDGTVIPESVQRAAKPAVAAPSAAVAATPSPAAAAAVAPATTGKQTARVAETRSDDGAATQPSAGSMPLSIAPLGQRQAAPPRQAAAPTEVASAPAEEDAAAAPARRATGDFAVQLGAPGSEHEAREVFANLKRRYPAQLGPLQPTIVKAQSGGRTVYRVRVGEMSRDEATKLCQRLKSAGGSCFVAR
ncbi:SPOR domain-containing protein [Chelatococcus reniformis]|uniref:SPOR domain-containing protein n=1 Tax=Chelatococcus reniformis TaxID=1494448 RepID=A0A916UEF4_9HYPH|nr:SPOR domain-containing protein [Chelatococcus reniformis]GGC69309.1 hypothetical protein GCM10010994_29840 [Chelatococcus reniformis]